MVSLALPQTAIQQWLQPGRISRITGIVNLALVLWLAWQLAGLTWALFPAAEDGVQEAAPISRQPTAAAPQKKFDERQIADWHLFGVAEQEAPVKKATPVNAPETRLRLTLRGVFASDDADEARAIVGDPKGKEESYSIGDPLPGGATLSEIYPDRIILNRNGQFETLRLPKERTTASAPSRRGGAGLIPGGSARPSSGRQAAAFQKYRDEIKQNPSSFLKYVRATPAKQDGKFVGFRLQAGKQRGALAELGLRPGDIVTSINGVQIDSPAKGMAAMQALGEGSSADVTLLRGGSEVSVSLALP